MKMLEMFFFWWGEMWMEVEVDHLFFVFFVEISDSSQI